MRKKRHITIIVIGIIFILLIIIASYFALDDRLSNILLTVFTTLLGGAIAYYGVVKTIQHGIDERIIAERKHNVERKEDERKRFIPYLKVVGYDYKYHACVKTSYNLEYNFFSEENLKKAEGNNVVALKINTFLVKNITNASIILKEISFDTEVYQFKNIYILEPDEVAKIAVSENHYLNFIKLPNKISLMVEDMLRNEYSINCVADFGIEKDYPVKFNQGTYSSWLYKCTITHCGFPELIKAGENK